MIIRAQPRARYAVIGNPIAHSRSPGIHAAFAAQTGEAIEYGTMLAPLDGFAASVERFMTEGGAGLNVTLPFKEQACAWVRQRGGAISPRALAAGAVNTLRFDTGEVLGDNTDGAGLVRDLQERHGVELPGARVLLLGAGGAARGAAQALLGCGVVGLLVANRTPARARQLVAELADQRASAIAWSELSGVTAQLVLQATSAALTGGALQLPAAVFAGRPFCYDMTYAPRSTAFLDQARQAGCHRGADGLGMLVEQAAESFLVWRGVRPQTEPVYRSLRAQLDAA
ncbi:MAG: shikimate dehydrogenase [Burkholderiaceae bacterium]|nr:shikimate dehydrogenase [Burkholderiaceae bacterium]